MRLLRRSERAAAAGSSRSHLQHGLPTSKDWRVGLGSCERTNLQARGLSLVGRGAVDAGGDANDTRLRGGLRQGDPHECNEWSANSMQDTLIFELLFNFLDYLRVVVNGTFYKLTFDGGSVTASVDGAAAAGDPFIVPFHT